jgi:hypothetical protein
MTEFQFFFLMTEKRNQNDDWRSKMVWHRTSTGQRNKVKVKSLPKEDQYRYAPLEVKLRHIGNKPGYKMDTPSSVPVLNKPQIRVFTVYYSADRPKSFDEFTDGKLVMVTDDSAKAIEIEKKGHKVAVAHSVPLDAFKKYWDYESTEWKAFSKDIKDEEKFELIKFTDNDVYLVDFFKFKDKIDFQLSDPNAEDDKEKEKDK